MGGGVQMRRGGVRILGGGGVGWRTPQILGLGGEAVRKVSKMGVFSPKLSMGVRGGVGGGEIFWGGGHDGI